MEDIEKVLQKNDQELRGWIIERANAIENDMNRVILNYFKPERESKFLSILMNSTVINMGGKYTVLFHIDYFKNSIIENWRSLNSIRNYFAHTTIGNPYNITIEQSGIQTHINQPKYIEYLSSQGVFKRKEFKKAVESFCENYKIIKDYLKENEASL